MERILTLKRLTPQAADQTLGALLDGDTPFCLTLELPWKNNANDISCIPVGSYRAVRAIYASRYTSFLLQDVPGRTGIFLHKGNFTTDSRGCIILGERFDVLVNPKTGQMVNSVSSSGDAYNEFMDRLKGVDEFMLNVVQA